MNSYNVKMHVYNDKEMVEKWLENTKDCKISKELVPKCPVCEDKITEAKQKSWKILKSQISLW